MIELAKQDFDIYHIGFLMKIIFFAKQVLDL
jgi:hypothetical protein